MAMCACQVWSNFSPDGSKVLAHYDADGSTWLLDPTGKTEGTQLLSPVIDAASWQRLAPYRRAIRDGRLPPRRAGRFARARLRDDGNDRPGRLAIP